MPDNSVWVLVENYPDAGPEVTVFATQEAAHRDLAGRARESDGERFPDDVDDRVIAEEFLALWSGDITLTEETVNH